LRPENDSHNPVVLLAPLLIWAGYFLFVYVVAAIACARFPTTAVLPLLWIAGAGALTATALIGAGFYRRLRRESTPAPDRVLALRAGLLLSLLALIAIAWTALPTLFIRPCG